MIFPRKNKNKIFKVVNAKMGEPLVDSLVKIGWADSKGDAKKLLKNKAVCFSYPGVFVPEGYVFTDSDVFDYVCLIKNTSIAYVLVLPPKNCGVFSLIKYILRLAFSPLKKDVLPWVEILQQKGNRP